MANLIITNNDLGGVILQEAESEDVVIAFPAADTYVEGTILARRQVSSTVTVTPDAGNTGNGTVTAAPAAGDVIPLVGNYVLTCIEAVTNGGRFKLEDPNGNLVDGNLELVAGAGGSTSFTAGGLTFTITDGATDFAATDFFTLAVAADGNVVVYNPAGVGGAQIPSHVLTYEVSATGAENQAHRAMMSGEVRREKLVIDGGGTITDRLVGQLRDVGIVAQSVSELNIYDNQ